MDAGASADRLVLAVDVQRPLALEHVDHLVVDVAVVGRAAGGDHAEELGQVAAADLVRDEVAKLAIAACGQRGLVVVADDASAGRRGAVLVRRSRRDEKQRLRPRVLDLVELSRGDVGAGARLELVGLAVNEQRAPAGDCIEDFLDVVERPRQRAAGLVAGDVELQAFGAEVGVDRDRTRGRVALGPSRLQLALGNGMTPPHRPILPRHRLRTKSDRSTLTVWTLGSSVAPASSSPGSGSAVGTSAGSA